MKKGVKADLCLVGTRSAKTIAPAKTKVVFWVPDDIHDKIQTLVNQGAYSDRSKALIDLLRKALRDDIGLRPLILSPLHRLAVELDRSPEAILRLCVEGIIEMIDNPGSTIPLLVGEMRLRQKRCSPTNDDSENGGAGLA